VDASKRNRYLDAMGVDVWVRRPGAALAGVWVDPPPVQVSAEVASLVAAEAQSPSTPEPVASAQVTAHGLAAEPAGAAGPVVTARDLAGQPAGEAAPVAVVRDPVLRAVTAAEPAAGRISPALELPTRQPDAPGTSPAVARPPAQPLTNDEAARWEALRSEVLSCTKCPLHKTRTQGVLGVGPHRTDWMVIGEAPGAEEDRRGEPFVGRAGHLLDAMLHAIGLNRGSNVYIANVLKSRPPNNRDPRPEEVAACLPYLMRQIELLQPRLMLAVGRIAAQNLLATDLSLSRLRGKVHRFGELNTPLIVTYHPAYLLRTPSDKRKAWEDLKFARTVFRQLTDRAGTDGHPLS
jgi:DNA polymerase